MRTTIIAFLFTFLAFIGFAKNGNDPQKSYASLTAILVVGPQEDGTQRAMRRMDDVAKVFESYGVKVKKFYNKNANWDEITAASKQANFFVYSGHGGTRGGGGKSGGFTLHEYSVPTSVMLEELQLADNALILFKSVCRGAGSSAGDDGDIGIEEAKTRVADYADPFFDIGAASYYANNLGNGCTNFLKDFFEGKPLQTCFEASTQTWAKVEMTEEFPYDPNKKIGIASTDWGGTATRITYINGKKKVEKIPASKGYEIAFVGDPDFSIQQMTD